VVVEIDNLLMDTRHSFIITLDGPAGAGKSTLAKSLAKELGFKFLDTGAMYRTVALASLRELPFPPDDTKLKVILKNLNYHTEDSRVFLNNEEVTETIRTKETTEASGVIASNPLVREKLVEMQRQAALGKKIVCEGRDQGTVVFPAAQCKFFLTASPEVRAKRRFEELKSKGVNASMDELVTSMRTRDERDSSRTVGPLVAASDAILVDTSNLSASEVLDKLLEVVRARLHS